MENHCLGWKEGPSLWNDLPPPICSRFVDLSRGPTLILPLPEDNYITNEVDLQRSTLCNEVSHQKLNHRMLVSDDHPGRFIL